MKKNVCITVTVLALLCALPALGQESPGQVEMNEMMAKMRAITSPSESHKALERFIGEWNTEMRITMGGFGANAEKGIATVDWLMEGRWIQIKASGSMMGMPADLFSIMGYDNFKQSYVWTQVSNLDTAMIRSEGDMDPGGKALLFYGTLDEYLTGEHDKMVKTIWRFPSKDKMILEIHDLPIGENNTKVIEMTYTRRSKS